MLAECYWELAFPDLQNHLQTGIGLFCSEIHKWGMDFLVAFECVAKEQTAKHGITPCPSITKQMEPVLSQMSTRAW